MSKRCLILSRDQTDFTYQRKIQIVCAKTSAVPSVDCGVPIYSSHRTGSASEQHARSTDPTFVRCRRWSKHWTHGIGQFNYTFYINELIRFSVLPAIFTPPVCSLITTYIINNIGWTLRNLRSRAHSRNCQPQKLCWCCNEAHSN